MEETNLQIPDAIIKKLADKNQEKRLQAQKELEEIVKTIESEQAILAAIQFTRHKLFTSEFAQIKVSGLYLLEILSFNKLLHNKSFIERYVSELVPAILELLGDPEPQTRIQALECIVAQTRILKTKILVVIDLIFSKILEFIEDQVLTNECYNVDNILRQLVYQDVKNEEQYFDLNQFLQLVNQKILTKQGKKRILLVKWIKHLNQNPRFDLFKFLPLFLDGLFQMLNQEQGEIQEVAIYELDEFKKQTIQKSGQDQQINEQILNKLTQMIKASPSQQIIMYSQQWIIEYLEQLVQFKNEVLEQSLMNIFSLLLDANLVQIISDNNEIYQNVLAIDKIMRKIVDLGDNNQKYDSILFSIGDKLLFSNEVDQAITIYADWLQKAISKQSNENSYYIKDLIQIIISKISESSYLASTLLYLNIVQTKKQNIEMIIKCVIQQILIKQESQVAVLNNILQLDQPIRLYLELINQVKDIESINQKQQLLEFLLQSLINQNQLNSLYKFLWNSKKEEQKLQIDQDQYMDSQDLLKCLFTSFSYSICSILSLCLLSQRFELASELLQIQNKFYQPYQVIQEALKVFQLIESDSMIYVRMQIVYGEKQLIKLLQALLMICPLKCDECKPIIERLKLINSDSIITKSIIEQQDSELKDLYEKLVK